MSIRQRPETAWDWIERGWRPFVAWVCIVLVFVPLCVCAAVLMAAFTYGFITSILTGQPMPDLTAGWDRVLPSIMPYVGPGLAGLMTLLLSRHREVTREIDRGGGQPRPTSGVSETPSEPSPSGGLVNQDALR